MGKRRGARRAGPAGGAAQRHPLIEQARPSAELIAKGGIEVADVPNPYGEVIVAGDLRRHRAVKRQPAWVTLHRQGVITRSELAALEWYDARLATAEGGIYKCGLADGGGGGSPSSHIPVSEAMIQAGRDVAWARSLIPAGCHRAFDLVMIDQQTFSESARREAAGRHGGAARRLRAVLSAQFRQAARALCEGYARRYGSTVRGILVL